MDQMDLIEINEAFAAIPLVSTKLLAKGDEKKWKELREKTKWRHRYWPSCGSECGPDHYDHGL